MNSIAIRADFFDASALVKVYCNEPGSDAVRQYFYDRATKYTTPFCFYEAMNILKGKWKFKKQLTTGQYFEAAHNLTSWFGASSSKINDLDFTNPLTFFDAKNIAARNGLDLSDAFQILSIKSGYFSLLVNDSATMLVTTDKELSDAARNEGIKKIWNVLLEPIPR